MMDRFLFAIDIIFHFVMIILLLGIMAILASCVRSILHEFEKTNDKLHIFEKEHDHVE